MAREQIRYGVLRYSPDLWRCPECDVGGDPIDYRWQLSGGLGKPRGTQFIQTAKLLCVDAGVAFPEPQKLPSAGRVVTTGTGKLSIEAAAERAKTILESRQPELVENIRLEEVRQQCGIGSYDWERKILKPLRRDLEPDRFKIELLNLLAVEDPVERIRQQAEIAPRYQMPMGCLEKALSAMKRRTITPESECLPLDEFFNLSSEALKWVIPEMLPAGELVECFGMPQSGKTLLSIDAAFCVATGEEAFLGQPVKQGKVLMVSVDQSPESTKAKFQARGFRACDAPNVHVMAKWDISQLAALEKVLEAFRPTLVVLDSLKRISLGSGISENSDEFADPLYIIKELLNRYGASGLLIHHSNKSNDAAGLERGRGSTAIQGACWGQWLVEHIIQKNQETKRLFIDPKDTRRIL